MSLGELVGRVEGCVRWGQDTVLKASSSIAWNESNGENVNKEWSVGKCSVSLYK